MEIKKLDRKMYEGRKFTLRYITNGYYDIAKTDMGFQIEYKHFANPTELTAELLNTPIEKIVVHEAVKNEDGSRKQKVDIYYRFIGKID